MLGTEEDGLDWLGTLSSLVSELQEQRPGGWAMSQLCHFLFLFILFILFLFFIYLLFIYYIYYICYILFIYFLFIMIVCKSDMCMCAMVHV